MFTYLKAWFHVLLFLFKMSKKPAPSAVKEEDLLKLDLQFFADDDPEDDPEDDHEDDPDDDVPNLDELLKDPKFKKQYNAKLKDQLGKRMSKFKDVDPEEYRRLKEQAGDKKDKKEDNAGDDAARNDQNEKRLLRAEHREKTALVKEFAVDNGHNPKLLARLINIDSIELDEDGNADNLDELFEELEEEFPEYFSLQDDDDDEEDPPKKKSRFNSVPKQKTNPKKKVDPHEAGRQKALERHQKKEDKR
ncbi:hypothetical protein [Domibacillus mangrovi]|uniref:Uncharacterized protein n=1 Tax=Domibacillus mangrovi TaxID=1714354 RepID=A0A1Q5P4D4_9BACI|nr:hypothetical protein [Domibacillus mangrovi]OKL37001.1 hypothetical protein BLL40_05260 [Domibacillus mangrovi]